MFWPKEVIILRIGKKQRKVKKSHTSQSHSATLQWKRNASHIMTYIFKIYKHYCFCFLWTAIIQRVLYIWRWGAFCLILFRFILYGNSTWTSILPSPSSNVRSFSVAASMGYPGYPWISLRFQCFRIRRHIVTKSGNILWILGSVVLYMIQCADLRTGVQLAGYP